MSTITATSMTGQIHVSDPDPRVRLQPWAGLAVFCGYAALALGLAMFRLRGRDA
ncbi:hypothetical protein [Nonomuraea sp. NEAU-A123]|uniref:hypothetical protein n=1 Tax=Nonomuraea sp. NEAU-A123 TaxID=2839649 RepID=UPI001BE4CD57|nr:hypothetical protein [Nonomuraea sp. NEAU-A123]MBT2225307.1 hypothetical protein [Nonomuraea sp. NEAU-A123]